MGESYSPLELVGTRGFNHGGNFAAAILAGTIGQRFGYQWIFYLVCLFALESAVAVTLIRPQEIDHDIARGGEDKHSATETDQEKKATAIPIAALFKRRELLIFLTSVVLFHPANAAMLPMAGQVLAKKHPGADIIALSGCIIAAQLMMLGVRQQSAAH